MIGPNKPQCCKCDKRFNCAAIDPETGDITEHSYSRGEVMNIKVLNKYAGLCKKIHSTIRKLSKGIS